MMVKFKIIFLWLLISLIIITSSLFYFPNLSKQLHENRKLTFFPSFNSTFTTFTAQLEEYIKDHFPFRHFFIPAYASLPYFIFKSSPVNSVLIGPNGYLYNSFDLYGYVSNYYNISVSSFPSASRLQTYLVQFKKFCLDRNIKCVIFLIIPSKTTIYSEELPPFIDDKFRFDYSNIFRDAFPADKYMKIVDLREKLTNSKHKKAIFDPIDGHWNDYGAYLGYQALMDSLRDCFSFNIKKEDSLKFHFEKRNNIDLPSLMGLGSVLEENYLAASNDVVDHNRKQLDTLISETTFQSGTFQQHSIYNSFSKINPTVLFVHDSFLYNMRPFLFDHFSAMHFTLNYFSDPYVQSYIDKKRPDILVIEMIERNLYSSIQTMLNVDEDIRNRIKQQK